MAIKKIYSILIINPNSTERMTEALQQPVERLGYENVKYSYLTAPSGPTSINNENDAAISSQYCLPALIPLLDSHDAFLVCCYSQHPLVPALRAELRKTASPSKPVTGIFDASVAVSLQILDNTTPFGIVSTGSQWSDILTEAVTHLLGATSSIRYAGTETTGLNATELHDADPEEVSRLLRAATVRLVQGRGARAVCLGCAGMVGLGQIVRMGCIEAVGDEDGSQIRIVDGVESGIGFLVNALRMAL